MSNYSIGTRLTLGFGLLLFLALLNTALGNWQLLSASQASQSIIDEPLAKERLISDWYRYIHTAVRRTTAIAKSADASLATYFAAEQKASAESTTAIQAQVQKLMATPEEQRLFDEIAALRKTYTATRDEVIRLKREGDPAAAERLLDGSFVPAAQAYVARVNDLLQLQRKALDQAAAPIRAATERARALMLALGGLTLLVGMAGAVAITRSIVRPLRRSVQVAHQVAKGDLSPVSADVAPDTRDESSRLLLDLDRMQGSLTRVIQSIREAADSMSTSAPRRPPPACRAPPPPWSSSPAPWSRRRTPRAP